MASLKSATNRHLFQTQTKEDVPDPHQARFCAKETPAAVLYKPLVLSIQHTTDDTTGICCSAATAAVFLIIDNFAHVADIWKWDVSDPHQKVQRCKMHLEG